MLGLTDGTIAAGSPRGIQMFFRRSVSALAVATLLCATNAAAQTRHVVAPDVLRQTMTAQLAAEAAHREAIREVFHHDQVRDVASRLG